MNSGTRKDPEQTRLLENLVQKARSLSRRSDTSKEAIEVNTEILKIDPSRSDAYVRRGTCYLERSKWDAAEKDFRNAVASNPGNRIARKKLDEVQKIREKLEEDKVLRERWHNQGFAWSVATSRCAAYSVRRVRPGYFREPTLLYTLGYSIVDPASRRNLSRQERWRVLVEQALPTLGLCEAAWTIANNCHDRKRNAREKYSYAIAEWEHDLARLRRVFYHEAVASWPWPPAEPM